MIIVAHFCNEIINHYNISTPEKLGGGKFRQQPHSVANPTKAEHAHQAQKKMASWRIKTKNQSDIKTHHAKTPMCSRSDIRITVIGSPAWPAESRLLLQLLSKK